MDAVVAAAERVGAWLLADEVYSGAERLSDTQTPSFWGRYDKVLAMNSLSKAYGLPGLRIGWVVGPANTRLHPPRLSHSGCMAGEPRGDICPGPAPGSGHRLCPLSSRCQFDRIGAAVDVRKERAHRSGRPFWPGSLPANQLWPATRLPPGGAGSHPRVNRRVAGVRALPGPMPRSLTYAPATLRQL